MVRFADLWLHVPPLFRRNFASNKKTMKRQSDFPEALCADEAVCFIADRHHVTPQQLLRHFLAGASSSGSEASIRLEQNEIEILKGLSGAVKG